jgi:hypothetical protein
MVALLHLASWVVGLLAAAGVGLGLALLFRPELKQWPANFLQRHLFPDANQISLNRKKAGTNGTASRRNVYRILCFGDSLTEGFTRCVIWCVCWCRCVPPIAAAGGGVLPAASRNKHVRLTSNMLAAAAHSALLAPVAVVASTSTLMPSG